MKKNEIEAIAKFYRTKMKDNNVINLMRFFNIKIEKVHGEPEYKLIFINYKAKAFISNSLSDEDSNFRLACIFGNYCLHIDAHKKLNNKEPSIETEEAEWFAYNLLMPELSFRKAIDETKNNMMLLMIKFFVSSDIIQKRKEQLNIYC